MTVAAVIAGAAITACGDDDTAPAATPAGADAAFVAGLALPVPPE